jgi:hypothetical protein
MNIFLRHLKFLNAVTPNNTFLDTTKQNSIFQAYPIQQCVTILFIYIFRQNKKNS